MNNKASVPPEEYITSAVATFLAACDSFEYNSDIKTAGTSIIRGKLRLMVGDAYIMATPEEQLHILQHECGHLVSNHFGRKKDRQNLPWNVVCDASLHYCGIADPLILNQALERVMPGARSAEFSNIIGADGKTIPPMPPEMAYELLPRMAGLGCAPGCGECSEHSEGHGDFSCDSIKNSQVDTTPESMAKRAIVAAQILGADKDFRDAIMNTKNAGQETGPGRDTPELPPPPLWIRKTINYLIRTQDRTDRRRSWRRENRAFLALPGQSKSYGRGALFLIDASGSIGSERLAEFLSAITRTPELRGSLVVVFDSRPSNYIPANDIKTILDTLKSFGGGTSIKEVGEKVRLDHMPAVWLTDACTGDGWPRKHTQHEVWCVYGGAASPPNGITIRID
jgi:hypothetical protein